MVPAMRVTAWRCDGCGCKLSEGDESRERCFQLSTPFASDEVDICRECWERMCAAIGKIWDNTEHRLVPQKGSGR